MEKLHGEKQHPHLWASLISRCEACCGLCCTMLYFAKSEGFPEDKAAGTPCGHLQPDFRCRVHSELGEKKLKGCLAFDCLGAGQKVTQQVYGGRTWREESVSAAEMEQVFVHVWQLQQILGYLLEAQTLAAAQPLADALEALIAENQRLGALPPEELAKLAVEEHRAQANRVLKKAWTLLQQRLGVKSRAGGDYIGRKFKRADLSGRDLSMSLLIAADLSGCQLYGANLLGADLRDARLNGADLSRSLFLTQAQLNSAHGDGATKLPEHLQRPAQWQQGAKQAHL